MKHKEATRELLASESCCQACCLLNPLCLSCRERGSLPGADGWGTQPREAGKGRPRDSGAQPASPPLTHCRLLSPTTPRASSWQRCLTTGQTHQSGAQGSMIATARGPLAVQQKGPTYYFPSNSQSQFGGDSHQERADHTVEKEGDKDASLCKLCSPRDWWVTAASEPRFSHL